MLSRNQTTQVDDVNYLNSFKRNPSEKLKESQRRQAKLDAQQHQQDLKIVGLLIMVAFVAFLAGLAI